MSIVLSCIICITISSLVYSLFHACRRVPDDGPHRGPKHVVLYCTTEGKYSCVRLNIVIYTFHYIVSIPHNGDDTPQDYCTGFFPVEVPERRCVPEAYRDYSRTQTSHC